ncbi:hypothetical protein GU700_23125 [Methylobacterium sp. NI91]|nr:MULTISPECIES: hypothetical protein [unclassified Methylobacterium]QIJ77209.1 hypothetical protein CLZ_23130 [Methylobacterium sp. CLZ]QIJ82113.1 hypothetical protein GU700_23125 [Methylobacterium sp. NI91]
MVDVPPLGEGEPTERIEIRGRSIEAGTSGFVSRRLRNGFLDRIAARLSRRPKNLPSRSASDSTEPSAWSRRVAGSRMAPTARMTP